MDAGDFSVPEMMVGQPLFIDEDPMGIYQQILIGKVSFPLH